MNGHLDVSLDSAGSWIELPVERSTDPDAWAAATMADAMESMGLAADADRLDQLTALYAGLARNAIASNEPQPSLVGVYVLPRAADLGPLVAATLRAIAIPDGSTRDDVVRMMIADPAELYAPADVEEFDTHAGPAVRIVQHLLDPNADTGDVQVEQQLVYLWPRPDDGIAVVLSSMGSDLTLMAAMRPVVDALAASLRLESGA